jgi:hypothetical protein
VVIVGTNVLLSSAFLHHVLLLDLAFKQFTLYIEPKIVTIVRFRTALANPGQFHISSKTVKPKKRLVTVQQKIGQKIARS